MLQVQKGQLSIVVVVLGLTLCSTVCCVGSEDGEGQRQGIIFEIVEVERLEDTYEVMVRYDARGTVYSHTGEAHEITYLKSIEVKAFFFDKGDTRPSEIVEWVRSSTGFFPKYTSDTTIGLALYWTQIQISDVDTPNRRTNRVVSLGDGSLLAASETLVLRFSFIEGGGATSYDVLFMASIDYNLLATDSSRPLSGGNFAAQGPVALDLGAQIQLDLDEAMDLYPTEPNGTVIEVSYVGMTPRHPISLEVIGPIPTYLEVGLDPKNINPSRDWDGSNLSRLEVKFDYSKAGGLALPSEHRLTIRATNGTVHTSSEIVLRLLKPEWLVMLYMCADTHPDLEVSMLGNLYDMCIVSGSTGNPKVGMMVLIDLRRPWIVHPDEVRVFGVSMVPADNAQLYQVVDGNLSKIGGDWGPSNLSSEAVLERFVRESVSRIPSKHIHLILSDHGGGIRGIDWDFHQGDKPMKYGPMKAALRDHKVDILSFDACLMAQIEILYHLRDVAEFFTCSERTVPGYGYAFNRFLVSLTTEPEISVLNYVKAIVKPFEARYDGSPSSKYRSSATLSGIDSSKLIDIASAMDGLAKAIHQKYVSHDASFNRTMSQLVYKSWEADAEPYTDIMDFARNIVDEPGIRDEKIREAALETIVALQSAVVANVEVWFNATGHRKPSGYNGLAALIWRKGYDYAFAARTRPSVIYRFYLKHYDETAFSKDTAWRVFLEDFAKSLPASVNALTLFHPAHELYLHVYDSQGRHVGYNPSIVEQNSNQIELGVPDSFYIDYRNGTKTILLPTTLRDFDVVVDGSYMDEMLEPYQIECALILDGELVDHRILENSISLNTNHSTSVTVQDGGLITGETKIQVMGENPLLVVGALGLAAIVASLHLLINPSCISSPRKKIHSDSAMDPS